MLQVLQDAYDQLNGLGEGLHSRIRIQVRVTLVLRGGKFSSGVQHGSLWCMLMGLSCSQRPALLPATGALSCVQVFTPGPLPAPGRNVVHRRARAGGGGGGRRRHLQGVCGDGEAAVLFCCAEGAVNWLVCACRPSAGFNGMWQ